MTELDTISQYTYLEARAMFDTSTFWLTFDQWELADRDGWSIAHSAAERGLLPPHFDKWELKTKEGWSVAHTAAVWCHLPEDFDKWDISDEAGWTVAHVTAQCGTLPENFDLWDLCDDRGVTVKYTYEKAQLLTAIKTERRSDNPICIGLDPASTTSPECTSITIHKHPATSSADVSNWIFMRNKSYKLKRD